METKLTLEKIEKTKSGVEFANIICELPFERANAIAQRKETLTVKLRSTGLGCRIMSDHLVYEMKYICETLDTAKISKWVKEILQSNKFLNETKTI
tara:strand:+ start:5873 stop:6160 length:288 start_codon:yes stop_codon:yes gene_type:complete